MSWPTHRSKEQDKWNVDVYRFTTNKGWEFYQDSVGLCSSERKTNGEVNKTDTSKEIDTCIEPITAAPRRGSIDIKRLRLRIHLFHSPQKQTGANKTNAGTSKDIGSNNTTQDACPSSRKPDERAQTTVVRRRDRILLSTRKGFGAVLLKFRSVTECVAFSDRLVELNHDFTLSSPAQNDTPSSAQRPTKRIRRNENEDNTKNGNEHLSVQQSPRHTIQTSNNVQGSAENTSVASKSNMLSYIVRLLHDDDFLDFIDSVETSLSSSPDCEHILDGLTYPRPPKACLNQYDK